mgnify:CR=1 FL=1
MIWLSVLFNLFDDVGLLGLLVLAFGLLLHLGGALGHGLFGGDHGLFADALRIG